MMGPGLFLRLALWLRRPPSRATRRIIAGVAVTGLVLVGIEYFFGWPDALTVNQPTRGLPRP